MITIVDYGMGNLGAIQNMFRHIGVQAAISAGSPVQAVALDYRLRQTGMRSSAVTYANPLTLLQSLLNTLGHGPYTAQVVFAPPQSSAGQQRKHLAADLRGQIVALREA